MELLVRGFVELLLSEHGTHKTVKARFRPWLSGKVLEPFDVFPLRSAAARSETRQMRLRI